LTETANYFKLAADQNLAYGQFNYCFCLGNGDGVPINADETLVPSTLFENSQA
jgi:TPR repeat protein